MRDKPKHDIAGGLTRGGPLAGQTAPLSGPLAGALIVCESSGSWAAAWRRAQGEEGPLVVEARSRVDVGDALRQGPASVAAFELQRDTATATLDAVAEGRDRFPHAAFVVLTVRALRGFEPAARELGVWHFVDSWWKLRAVVAATRARLAEVPPPKPSWSDAIWARLPLCPPGA